MEATEHEIGAIIPKTYLFQIVPMTGIHLLRFPQHLVIGIFNVVIGEILDPVAEESVGGRVDDGRVDAINHLRFKSSLSRGHHPIAGR